MATGAAFAVLGVLAAGCAAPGSVVAVDRLDPSRFEECRDPAGQAAWQDALTSLQEGRDADALDPLRRVVECCPEFVAGHRYYQDTALQVGGEAAAAMRAWYQRLDDGGGSPVPAYMRARLLESSYAKKQALDELLKQHPDFAWGHLAMARLYRSTGRLGDAVESYRRALARHPALYDAHLEVAETLVELGRVGEAQLPFENYLRAEPNDRDAIRAFVQLLIYRLDDAAAAMPWIERLLRDDPQDEAARMELAAAHWRTGKPELALQEYLGVLERRPDNARAALNVGYLHYDALAKDDASRRVHWPKARLAFRLFLQLVRPEEAHVWFEQLLAVPYRLKAIDDLLGPDDGALPKPGQLR